MDKIVKKIRSLTRKAAKLGKRVKWFNVLCAGIAINAVILFITGIHNMPKYTEKPYSEFISSITSEEVKELEIQSDNKLDWKKNNDNDNVIYYSYFASIDEMSKLIDQYTASHKDVETKVNKNLNKNVLDGNLFPTILNIAILFFLLRKLKGSEIGFGKVNFTPVTSKVKFADVAGIDEEKEQLMMIVEFLKNPKKFENAGARIPKGVLLFGSPGTGKTLLAKAIAGEAMVPFFSLNGSSFEEKFVVVGASRIRELFKQAKKCTPSIIFIDEFESVACKRFSDSGMKNEQTLNQLLAEMDGFESSDNVIVIAATNHMDHLDPAVTRPGRFDRHVFIPKPDKIARLEILKVHARNKKLAEDVKLAEIAQKTVGFTGADLENILNESAISSVKANRDSICMDDVNESIAKVMVGLKKERSAITEADRWILAIHEAGHAVVSSYFRPDVKNYGISIVPRNSGVGGYNQFDDYKSFTQKHDFLNRVKTLYGGRAAEMIILNDISTGASNDLKEASKIAIEMVSKHAMGDRLLSEVEDSNVNKLISEINLEKAETICKDCYAQVSQCIKHNKDVVIQLAKELMKNEYVSEKELEEFWRKTTLN